MIPSCWYRQWRGRWMKLGKPSMTSAWSVIIVRKSKSYKNPGEIKCVCIFILKYKSGSLKNTYNLLRFSMSQLTTKSKKKTTAVHYKVLGFQHHGQQQSPAVGVFHWGVKHCTFKVHYFFCYFLSNKYTTPLFAPVKIMPQCYCSHTFLFVLKQN